MRILKMILFFIPRGVNLRFLLLREYYEINYYSMEGKIVNNQKGKRKRTRIDLEKFNWRRNYRYSLFFIPREGNSYNFYYYIVRKY